MSSREARPPSAGTRTPGARLAIRLLVIALAVITVRTFVVTPHRVTSGSMTPTLQVGDLVLADRFSYGVRMPLLDAPLAGNPVPQRGDVVVFTLLRPDGSDARTFVKRVIGLPGERIRLEGNRLAIDGAFVPTRPLDTGVDCLDPTQSRCRCDRQAERLGTREVVTQHLSPPPANTAIDCVNQEDWPLTDEGARTAPEVLVPDGHVLCLGDNRDNSSDGRSWGFLPLSHLRGRVLVRLWPPARGLGSIR